ncbi:restriction endonuclease subunit S [Polaromonas sp.]|uniref:restriction endonuclease subunit S n=1 Tax=Polaromonas sp. TaxID=1869339 RepID=UPI0032670CD3
MNEWRRVALRHVSTHIKDGTHGTHRRVESGIPLLSAKNVGRRGRLEWDKSDDLISESDYAALTSTFAPKAGDLLLTVVGSIGRSAVFDGSRVAFQRSVAFVRSSDAVLPCYLFQASCSEDFSRQLERRCNVTAQAGLYLGELAKISIPLPPKQQQQKIATILTSIDTAIEKTEALIAKYEQIKAGLMHDLFTRGVLPNGQPRPPREQAPDLYQETAIGWIPRGWTLQRLDNVADVIDPNPSHRNPIYHPAGFPFISTVEFIESDEVETNTPRRVVEEIVEEQERRCQFTRSSIGFSRKGTIGEIRFLPVGIRFALLDSLCVINPKTISASYLFHSLRSDCLTRQSKNMTMGQALPQVSIGRVRDLLVPTPDSSEQIFIENRFDAVMTAIKKQSANEKKLRQQKIGLMQDLLTGKVEVKLNKEPTGFADG